MWTKILNSSLSTAPFVRKVKTISLRKVKKNKLLFFKEFLEIKKFNKSEYDFVLDMQGLFKSSLVSFFLSKKRFGFDKNSTKEKLATSIYTNPIFCDMRDNTIDRYAQLAASAFEIKITKDQIINKKPYLFFNSCDETISRDFFSDKKKNIIFIVGSTWESRMYPKQQFVELGQKLDANILIPYGSSLEKETADFIAKNLPLARVLPLMNINQLKACVSKADLVIGGDTGPTYIAWANNIPCIILFGPTPTSRIYETPLCKVLKSPSDVDPLKMNKNDFSIKKITVESILTEATKLLNNSSQDTKANFTQYQNLSKPLGDRNG